MSKKSMKDAKVNKKELKKLAKQVNQTEEQKEIKKFLIILLIVVLIIVGVYFFTRAFVTKDLNEEETTTETTFDYTKTILGSLLNRPYDEYYVLVYNSEDVKANYYANLVSSYQTKDDAIKIYIADLNDEMNSKFYNAEESNPNAQSVSELQVSDLTLIKVKNKKISKYIEDVDKIKTELGI
jgi:hypothetical protein